MTQIVYLKPPEIVPDRSTMLRTSTRTAHEGVDEAIMKSGALDSPQDYHRFVRFQHHLILDVEPLYRRADLQKVIPDLSQRSRLAAVHSDAKYLGINPPVGRGRADLYNVGIPEALGWLYVSEGSNLGAAFLAKLVRAHGLTEEAGATHLAAPAAGRAAHWRAFTASLNSVKHSAEEDRRTMDGARTAFAHVRALISAHL